MSTANIHFSAECTSWGFKRSGAKPAWPLANRSSDGKRASEGPGSDRTMCASDGWIATALGVYLLLCSIAPLYLMATVWCKSLIPLDRLLPLVDLSGLDPAQVASVQTFTYAACGAILGAIIACLRGLHLHAVVLGNFRRCYSGSYLIGPWAAALLGITSYAMVRGGLLVLGSDQPGEPDQTSCYAYLALGILTGFSWERMLARVDDVARQIFGSRGDRFGGRPVGQPV